MAVWRKMALVAAAAAFLPSLAMANTVKFVNKSSWSIYYIYMSPSKSKNWGKDYLDGTVLIEGETLTIRNVKKGKWDVKVVDEDDDECILTEVDIEGDDTWVIEDKDLLNCQANS